MDIYDVAQYFDGLEVTDAYSNAVLFTCQMDQYDGNERDSSTGWRRTCSAGDITVPTRRAVKIDSQAYLVGRLEKDYLCTRTIREHALLHPSDGLFTLGSAKQFITASTSLLSLHGAQSLQKEQKEEGESSQLFSLYSVYLGLNESASKDQIIKSPGGVYYRIQNVETQTGQYKTVHATELGASALLEVTYIASSGDYDHVTDLSGAETPVLIDAFFERYQSNYRYMTWAAEKFQNGDKVLTVNAEDVPAAANNDRVQVNSIDYRVLAVQSDGSGCWELHIRPATMSLVVET
jgi:hypothetical protein